MHSFTYLLLIHSLVGSFHLLTDTSTRSRIHFTHLSASSLTHWYIHSLTWSCIRSLIHLFVHSLILPLLGHALTHSLGHSPVHSLTHSHNQLPSLIRPPSGVGETEASTGSVCANCLPDPLGWGDPRGNAGVGMTIPTAPPMTLALMTLACGWPIGDGFLGLMLQGMRRILAVPLAPQ